MRIPVRNSETRGYVYAMVDDDLSEATMRFVLGHEWSLWATSSGPRVKAYGRFRGLPSHVSLHRIIMDVSDPTSHVTFRNGDYLDNRRFNLIVAPPAGCYAPNEPDENGYRYRKLTLALPETLIGQLDQMALENKLSRSRQLEQLLHHVLRTMQEAVTPQGDGTPTLPAPAPRQAP